MTAQRETRADAEVFLIFAKPVLLTSVFEANKIKVSELADFSCPTSFLHVQIPLVFVRFATSGK